jgi:hypothetical protein
MAVDQKGSALTVDSAPSLTDRLVTIEDPGGTPATKTATIASVLALGAGLHEATHLVGGTDPLVGLSPSQITGTAVVTADSRLSDARTPTAHTHPQSDVTGLVAALLALTTLSHTHVVGEAFAGDAVTVAFVLAHTPTAGSVAVYVNGIRVTTWTLAVATVTFTSAPALSDEILIDYRY